MRVSSRALTRARNDLLRNCYGLATTHTAATTAHDMLIKLNKLLI
jgi:hypothetical protein